MIALLLALLTPGCLGSVTPAEIAPSALQQNNWRESSRSTQSVALGLGEVVQIEYGERAPAVSQFASGIILVTANNVPLLTEARFIPQALERVEQQRGVEFVATGSRSLSLTNLGASITGTEYDIRGAVAPAKALVITPDCSDFVVVAAFGVVETGGSGGGIFGGGSSGTRPYDRALQVAAAVTC